MIHAGLAVLFLAFALAIARARRSWRDRALNLEAEWLSTVERGLSREFLFLDLPHLRKWTRYVLYAGIALSLITLSLLPAALGFLVFGFGPRVLLRTVQAQRRKKFEKQFGRALPQIASILRAGHTFERALQSLTKTAANPLAQEFELVLKEILLGSTMDEALGSLLSRFPHRDLEILIRAVSISRRVGSNLAEAFATVSDLVENRSRLRDRLSALTAQGRTQAYVAILMPVGLLLVLDRIDPDYLAPLLYTGTGRAILGICAAMLLTGGFWIRQISRMELIR